MKGQFWSVDMIFAIVIFSGAIVLLSIAWTGINSQFSSSYSFNIGIMQLELNGLLNRLQGPGTPQNWNQIITANSVSTWGNTSIGLESQASGPISTAKLFALAGMANTNYQAAKQPLGVGYDYYITITSQNQYNITIGRNPFNGNATAIQTATVPVVLDNGQAASMTVILWTNTTFGVS